MDIEGTVTSISFVSDVLFPYFRSNLHKIKSMLNEPLVLQALNESKVLIEKENPEVSNLDIDTILDFLNKWSLEDRKITPLKTLQGLIWEDAYKSGEIKGHLYDEVAEKLKEWKNHNIHLGIFSSGSVAAQKLLFGFSVSGDLNPLFDHNFDTLTGGKKDHQTYQKISEIIGLNPTDCLFLSDRVDELEAAKKSGWNTIQLCRENMPSNWKTSVTNLNQIIF